MMLHKCKMKLFPYQKEGVRWLLKREFDDKWKGGFLCDEMGLGKTIQTIALMMLNRVKRTLIVVPNSLVAQWIDEIKTHSKLSVDIFDGKADTDVCITTYSQFTSNTKNLAYFYRYHWNRIVIDEGHEIRNSKSKRFRNICKLSSDIRWVLSGTPVYNKMSDYRTLLRFIIKDSPSEPRKEDIILRRTKEDVKIEGLPVCYFENVELDMSKEEEEIYSEAFEMYRGQIKDAITNQSIVQIRNMIVLEALLRMRQLCIHPVIFTNGITKQQGEEYVYNGPCNKFNTIIRDINEVQDEKCLLFCQFKDEMDMFESELGKTMKVYRLDGSVPQANRKKVISNFKRRAEKCVFIIQIKVGGQGLNLQEATRVFITAPAWNPATELQAIARAHRTGQRREVFVKKYVYVRENPSVEEAIVNLQGHKSSVCASVLNDQRLLAQIPINLKKAKTIQTIRKIFQV